MDDSIDTIDKDKCITKFDLLKGYCAVPLTDKAKQISTFVTPSGIFQYCIIHFSMKNSQATFVRLINQCLGVYKGLTCISTTS